MEKFSTNRILKAAISIACLTIVFALLISIRHPQRLRNTAQLANHTEQLLQHIHKEILSMPVIETRPRSHVSASNDQFPGLLTIPKKNFLNPINKESYGHNACTGFQIII